MVGEVHSGYEDDAYGADYGHLIDAGWLDAEQSQLISDAAKRWVSLRRRLIYDHNGTLRANAAADLEAALVEVFGADFLTAEAKAEA